MSRLKKLTYADKRAAVSEIVSIFQSLRRDGKHFNDFVPALLKSTMSGLPITEYLDWEPEELIQCDAVQDVLEAYFEVNPFTDILGTVMNELNQLGHQKGLAAFHTPEAVSYCMAKMQMHGLNLDDYPDGFTVGECCAGTGSIVLQAMRVVYEDFGQAGLDKLKLNVNDLDQTAIQCCTYQILMTLIHGTEAKRIKELIVTQGDALTAKFTTLYHISGIPEGTRIAC